MQELFERIEPALSFAREQLTNSSTDPAQALETARRAVQACWDFLTAHRPPVHQNYDPATLFAERSSEFTGPHVTLDVAPVMSCVGDPEQVLACLRALVGAAQLGEETGLVLELFEEADVPQLSLSLDGPGRFADPVCFGGYVPLAMSALAERWTVATRGGRIDKTANGWALRLRGIRTEEASYPDLAPLLEEVAALDRHVKAACQWAGLEADQAAPKPKALPAALADARAAVDRALALLDGAAFPKEPADLGVLLAEVEQWRRAELTEAGIRIETVCGAAIPPLMVHRQSLTFFFAALFDSTRNVLPEGGVVSLLLDYDPTEHAAALIATLTGPKAVPLEPFQAASMRRAVVEKHGGLFECTLDPHGVAISASIPDPAGRELAAWIPGMDAFSQRSQQMLRLLKNSGQPGLEAVILDGVLEEELERWLLPKISVPHAMHLAQDLVRNANGLPGASPERWDKALSQIRRGKPKKEICQPQYAGEILWAYAVDERHRAALGADRLSSEDLRSLCTTLLQTPVNQLAALRLIAKVLAP